MKANKSVSPLATVSTIPKTEQVSVTPEIAERWLALNTNQNRKLSKRTVDAYAIEMASGRWRLTHQGIAFNIAGELIDGQHRLTAVIKAGESLGFIAVPMLVTTGLPLDYHAPIDIGYGRTVSHVTGRDTRIVSLTRALYALENGLPGNPPKFTAGLCEEVYARHADAIEETNPICRDRLQAGVRAVLAYAYPLAPDTILNLSRQIRDGELLEKGDPAHTLRRWLGEGRLTDREVLLGACGGVKAALTKSKLHNIICGRGSNATRDGFSNYAWIVWRRRGAGITRGTPSVDVVEASHRGAGSDE